MVTDYGGNKFGELHDVAIGVHGEVVVCDYTNKCVIVLDCNMTLLSVIGQGSDDNRLVGTRRLCWHNYEHNRCLKALSIMLA